ncbi:unnamed protein product [Musa banksii]
MTHRIEMLSPSLGGNPNFCSGVVSQMELWPLDDGLRVMELGSPNMEDGTPFKSELDVNSHGNNDGEGTENFQNGNKEPEGMQVCVNQERPESPVLPVDAVSEGLQSPVLNSTASPSPINKVQDEDLPIESEYDDDVENRSVVHSIEELRSNVKYHEYQEEKQRSSYNIQSGDLLDMCTDQTAEDEKKLGDSDPYLHRVTLSVDNNSNSQLEKTDFDNDGMEDGNFSRADNNLNSQPEKPDSGNDGLEDGNFSQVDNNLNSRPEKPDFGNDGIEDENFSQVDNNLNCQSEKPDFGNDGVDENCTHNIEMKDKDDHMMSVAHSDNVEMIKECSAGHSPRPTRKGTPSSPERELSVPMARSPDNKPSAAEDQLPTEISDRKTTRSPKHTPSPEKRAVGRKRTRDSFSPPARRKSPPGRMAHRDAHRRDSSPRKNLPASPRKRESPRRRDRSRSRSPVRRKDPSGHRRDHRGRSRSRSPYSRDHHRRSPRRRHSPGRRSPPASYHSRHRSPRRPWSPPTNRNTGVGRPGRNLFVAGFSYVTTERDLEKKFSRFGRVTDVRIVRDRRSGDSRGFGFLSLERDEDADAAIRALDQTEWNGRIVLVEKSKTSAR